MAKSIEGEKWVTVAEKALSRGEHQGPESHVQEHMWYKGSSWQGVTGLSQGSSVIRRVLLRFEEGKRGSKEKELEANRIDSVTEQDGLNQRNAE